MKKTLIIRSMKKLRDRRDVTERVGEDIPCAWLFRKVLFEIWASLYGCVYKLTSLPMCGFIAQLVEHGTGIAEVTGSNPVEALIFFRLLLSNCLNWKIYCDDHSSLCSK